MFGPTYAELEKVGVTSAVNYMTLLNLLVNKGLIHPDEIEPARIQAQARVDQAVEQQKQEAIELLRKDSPGAAALAERWRNDIS